MFFSRFIRPVTVPQPQASPELRPLDRESFRALVVSRQPFFAVALKFLAACLPERDAELHRWLEEAAEANDELLFIYAISAAAIGGRKLQASLLRRGTALMRTDYEFGWIAYNCEGNVTEELLEAVRIGGLSPSRHAAALFYGAAWWQKHREGSVPSQIVSSARELARHCKNIEAYFFLNALNQLLGNKELQSVIPLGRDAFVVKTVQKGKEFLLQMVDGGPFDEVVPLEEERGFTLGRPMRRAVPRIGRNVPCPCGGGKKYKDCCKKEDERRLSHSSDVAGVTTAELASGLDDYVTAVRLEKMQAHELARLTPGKVPPELIPEYLSRLATCKRYDELVRAFKTLGADGEREDDWIEAFAATVKDWRRDIAARLLKIHPQGKSMLSKLSPAARILQGATDAAKFCEKVNEEATAVLQSGDLAAVKSVALAVLFSPWRALGILVARGLLPLLDDAPAVFEEILAARDRLGLPPDDEMSDFMDERAARERKPDEAAPVQAAQQKHDEIAAGMRAMREELVAARREISLAEKRRRREAATAAATKEAPSPEDEALLKAREREAELMSLLGAAGKDRVATRREVEQLRAEVKKLKAQVAGKSATERRVAVEDEEPGEPANFPVGQPWRIPEYPKKFREALSVLPQYVGSSTMFLIGRIAAGDESAFKGIKKMHVAGVLEAKVSGDYRLLFRITPTHLQVVELVNRGRLERRLKLI